MPNVLVSINTRRPFGRNWTGKRAITALAKLLQDVNSGAVQSDAVVYGSNDTQSLGDAAYAGPACALLVGSTLTGAVSTTINGEDIEVTAAGGDTATQALLAAAIRADATVNGLVGVTTRLAKVTLATVLAGTALRVFGALFTAVNGSPAAFGEFDMSGNDTADALSLALAINRHPSLAGRCRAVSSAGVVYIGLLDDREPTLDEVVGPASATTVTINTRVPAASAVSMVYCLTPGVVGNAITATVAGTGLTLVTAGSGKLGGGTGGPTSMAFVVP